MLPFIEVTGVLQGLLSSRGILHWTSRAEGPVRQSEKVSVRRPEGWWGQKAHDCQPGDRGFLFIFIFACLLVKLGKDCD